MKIDLMRIIGNWAMGLILALPCHLFAQPVEENSVKAAFVYNFVLFTEWPAHALKQSSTINLCVNTNEPMSPYLYVLNDKPVKKYRLNVKQLASLLNLPSSCNIVFLSGEDRLAWPRIKKRISNSSVLTISDDADINESGSMIMLSTRNNRIVFDIDADAVNKSGLIMSSKLLRLAKELR